MTAMTISTVNSIRSGDGLPVPGILVGDTVLFALLGLLSEVAPAPAAIAAWGFIIAQVLSNPSIIPAGPAVAKPVPTPVQQPAA